MSSFLITGSNGFLGSQVCQSLHLAGHKVYGLDLRCNSDLDYPTYTCDLTSRSQLEFVRSSFEKSNIILDYIVHMASCNPMVSGPNSHNINFLSINEDDISRNVAPDIIGSILVSSVFIPLLKQSTAVDKALLFISSIYGVSGPDQSLYSHIHGFEKPITYSAAKSSVLGIMSYLSSYLRDTPIRSNALTLGAIGPINDSVFVHKYLSKIQSSHLGDFNDVINAITFMCSDSSKYLNGTTIVLDGGYLS